MISGDGERIEFAVAYAFSDEIRRRILSSVLSSDCYLLHAGFLLGLFSDSEDEGDMFLRSVG
jgi:hypothetical protein